MPMGKNSYIIVYLFMVLGLDQRHARPFRASPAFFFRPICGLSELCEGARRLEGGAKIALGLVVCSHDPVRNLALVPLFISFLIAVTKHLAESAYGRGIHFGLWFQKLRGRKVWARPCLRW